MRQELQQSVTNAVTSQPVVVSASGLTFGVGISTAFQVLPVVVGVLTSLAGLILSVILIRKAYYSTKLIKAQIEHLKADKIEDD